MMYPIGMTFRFQGIYSCRVMEHRCTSIRFTHGLEKNRLFQDRFLSIIRLEHMSQHLTALILSKTPEQDLYSMVQNLPLQCMSMGSSSVTVKTAIPLPCLTSAILSEKEKTELPYLYTDFLREAGWKIRTTGDSPVSAEMWNYRVFHPFTSITCRLQQIYPITIHRLMFISELTYYLHANHILPSD